MTDTPQFKQLGVKGTEFLGLETFPAPPELDIVKLTTTEFTSLCPITGQPDFQKIEVSYQPNQLCLESKSFKLYLMTFRSKGAFCEALSSQIAHEIAAVLKPQWLSVRIFQNPRGGIGLSAEATIVGSPENMTLNKARLSESIQPLEGFVQGQLF